MLGQAQIDEAGLASDLGRARERREYLSRCTAVGDAIAGPKADGRRQGRAGSVAGTPSLRPSIVGQIKSRW